eukprot:Platyproteum_vivax@DN2665_c0_g1_i2.p1
MPLKAIQGGRLVAGLGGHHSYAVMRPQSMSVGVNTVKFVFQLNDAIKEGGALVVAFPNNFEFASGACDSSEIQTKLKNVSKFPFVYETVKSDNSGDWRCIKQGTSILLKRVKRSDAPLAMEVSMKANLLRAAHRNESLRAETAGVATLVTCLDADEECGAVGHAEYLSKDNYEDFGFTLDDVLVV